ncbi:hypothetical protein GOV12_07490 [Candidatus Pacearchaeota archaeon]|nr:hypothetical protein [Candidatus Pacearchaeota archaeon]
MKILKFGGSSLASQEQITKVIDIVHNEAEECAVVVSAPGKDKEIPYKVTDLLLRLRGEINKSNNDLTVDDSERLLKKRFSQICSSFGLADLETKIIDEISSLRKDPCSVPYTSSRGENYMARIMARLLNLPFIDSRDFITPDLKTSYQNLQRIQQKSFVFPGFYGEDNKKIFTFSRGGSDKTGAILANAFDASMYENWTDVDGIYYANPRIIGITPQTVSHMTYKEIRELSQKGTNVFHSEAMIPLIEKNIQVNIRNTNNPNHPGTTISDTQYRQPRTKIAGIAGQPGFSYISIEKFMMDDEIGLGRRVFQIIEDHGLSYNHETTSKDSLAVVLENTPKFNKARKDLENELNQRLNPDRLIFQDNIALVAIVGESMVNTPGMLGRSATTLGNSDINIRCTFHAPAEYNITFGVNESEYEGAVNALYREFIDKDYKPI